MAYKKILLCLACVVFCFSITACGEAKADTATFKSYMLGSLDRNDTSEYELADKLLQSNALFAYELSETENGTVQVIYIWNNLLRRQLRLDIKKICDALPEKNSSVKIEFNDKIYINGSELSFKAESDTSYAALKAIFPSETYINTKELRNRLYEMIILLETLEASGDTEVIAIQTEAAEGLLLMLYKTDDVTCIYSLDDIPVLKQL